MASKISGLIEQVNVDNGTNLAIASTAYGYCETAAANAAKTVDMTGFQLIEGVTVHIRFAETNSASNPTLNINGTGAWPMIQYGTTAMSTTAATTGWYAGAVVSFTLVVVDSEHKYWVRDQAFNTNSTYTITSVWCGTAAATAAKATSNATYYSLRAGNIFELTLRYSNTAASALTLNVASTGAKPIYINGLASSSENYTLPAGKYIVYYNGTNYYFQTDGTLYVDMIPNLNWNKITSGKPDYVTRWPTWNEITDKPGFGTAALVDVEDITGSVVAWVPNYKKLTITENSTTNDLLQFQEGSNITLTVDSNNSSVLTIASSDNKVSQTSANDTNEYDILFKNSNVSSTTNDETAGIHYGSTPTKRITINPGLGSITAPGGFKGTATAATKDGNDQNIVDTYLTKAAGVTTIGWNNTTRSLTQTINGTTADVVSLATMGLANALHFIGVLDNGATIPAAGALDQSVTIDGNSITPATGDVVIEHGELREYVFANNKWYLLGFTAASIYEYTTTGNTWISDIKQYTDGRIEIVGTTTLDTSGKWTGTIATTKDETNTLYLMGVASGALGALKYTQAITIQGNKITTGKWEATTIDVGHGGTGATSFTANCVIMSGSTSTGAFTTRAVTDNTSAGNPTANTNLITANTLMNYTGTSQIDTVGTIGTGVWQGTTIGTAYGGTGNDTFIANRMVYTQTASKLDSATSIYSNGSKIAIGITSSFSGIPDNGIFQVIGTSITQNILPESNFTYNLGSSTSSWSTMFTRTTSTRYIDASDEGTDDKIYIGYGYVVPTSSTIIYCSTSTQRTAILTATSSGVAISNHLEINGTNSAYELYVNGSTNIVGETSLGNNLSFIGTIGSNSNNKIIWSESNNGNQASISYNVVSSTSQLCINTVKTGNKNCLIALSSGGVIKSYIDNSTPSFYPATDNSGSLGLTDHRWSHLYLGNNNSYGSEGLPIYWNNGVPQSTYTSEIVTWQLTSTSSSYTNNSISFPTDTQVIELVVTAGAQYLKSPLTWAINDDYTFTISATSVDGNISGYAILARSQAL